jgi:hypothetical protein
MATNQTGLIDTATQTQIPAVATATTPIAAPVAAAAPASTFDEKTYLANKANQLNATNYKGRTDWSPDQVAAAFAQSGLTAEQHYNQYGQAEGVYDKASAPNTGVAYTGNIATAKNQDWGAQVKAADVGTNEMRDITKEETVAGQLEGLIAADSPYMQSARSSGLQTANERGLMNSWLAAQLSEKSALDAAAPIAAQDASTYAASGLSAQNANQDLRQAKMNALLKTIGDAQALYNASFLQKQQGEIQGGLNQQQGVIQSQLYAQRDAATAALSLTLKNIDANIDIMKIASNDRSSYVSQLGNIMQNYQNAFTAIQTTPDSSINQVSKGQGITSLNGIMRANVVSLTNLYGYDVNWGATAAG